MFDILTVCTGNICRSPLAELLLRSRTAPFPLHVASAGTRGLQDAPMTAESQRLAKSLGAAVGDADAHRSRYLTADILRQPDLVLAMTRDHRRQIVELAPSRLRSVFTIREFARLSATMTDDAILQLSAAESEPGARLRAVVAAIGAQRGVALPPRDPSDDDVIDPYRRSWAVYQESAAQLIPAVDATVRVVKLAAQPA